MGRGTHRGFITYEELNKSLGKRNLSDENIYIQDIYLNGEKSEGYILRHEDIMAGGKLKRNYNLLVKKASICGQNITLMPQAQPLLRLLF